jgi:hypothetical protein
MTNLPATPEPAPILQRWAGEKRNPRWVSDTARFKQLGNAVCVPVVAEVADHVRSEPPLANPHRTTLPGVLTTPPPAGEDL